MRGKSRGSGSERWADSSSKKQGTPRKLNADWRGRGTPVGAQTPLTEVIEGAVKISMPTDRIWKLKEGGDKEKFPGMKRVGALNTKPGETQSQMKGSQTCQNTGREQVQSTKWKNQAAAVRRTSGE